MLIDLFRVRKLDHFAEIHHGDAVADVAHNEKIVGNEEIGQAQFILQFVKHVDDLRLNGNVKRGDRLVADDEFRVDGKRTGNADTLALTAGKLVGIARGVFAVEADEVHQLQYALAAFLFGFAKAVNVQGLGNDVGNGHARVQRGIGVLKDHGRLGAELFEVALGLHGFAVVIDLAARGLIELQNRAADGGLAAAGFADQTEGLTLFDEEGHVVHRFERLGLKGADADVEILFQVADIHQRGLVHFSHAHASCPSSSCASSASFTLTQQAAAWSSLICMRSQR